MDGRFHDEFRIRDLTGLCNMLALKDLSSCSFIPNLYKQLRKTQRRQEQQQQQQQKPTQSFFNIASQIPDN